MSQPLLKRATPDRTLAESERLQPPPEVAMPGLVPAATTEDWNRTLDLLKATAFRRDGLAAARHTKVRQRMRALARATRTLRRQP